MNESSNHSIIVLDTQEKIQFKNCDIALWQSYAVSDNDRYISIPMLVEENAELLRTAYLAMIYELGEAEVKDKRVVEYLEVRPQFSYWWMTLLVEKCNFSKSPQIDNVIKLMAFRNWLELKSYSSLSLVSSNSELANAMRLLTIELGIDFLWKKSDEKRKTCITLKSIYHCLPNPIQAFVWLIHYLISRWHLIGIGVDKWKQSQSKITFVSYLFHLDIEKTKKGIFKCGYWGELPNMLEREKVQSNWLHIYVKNELTPTAMAANELIDKFNRSHKGSQNHMMLESFISYQVIMETIQSWFRVAKLKKTLKRALNKKLGYLWPLFKKDLDDSFAGVTAMSNLLYYFLFSKAMSSIPPQEVGCYLLENQGWEFGFAHAWRRAKHDKLIGIAHSTVRYWDLRYYFDSRTYDLAENVDMPLPDFIGLNGDFAKKMYLDSGFPISKLVEVEALRFLYLDNVNQNDGGCLNNTRGEKTLLVLADFIAENTKYQMDLLCKASEYIDRKIQYIVKPHPAYPIIAEDYSKINLEVTTKPISELINNCSMVFTSNVTSAAVDAYCAGKQVVIVLDPVKLNLSPLKGNKRVIFVSNPKELAVAVNNIGQVNDFEDQGNDYFYLDPDLPRWKKLLMKNINIDKRIELEDI